MRRKKKKGAVPRRTPAKKSRGWFGRASGPDLDRLEERDWRRRIILASRKLQMVQTALSADISDVRGLRRGLNDSRPNMDRLQEELEQSRGVAGSLEQKLEEHASLLRKALEQQQSQVDPTVYEAKLRELENELGRVQGQLAHAQDTHAQEVSALTAEKNALLERGGAEDAGRAHELASLLRQSEERRAMQSAHHAEEVQDLRKLSESRIRELETELAHLRARPAAPSPGGTTERRTAELELQLRGLQSVRTDLEEAHREIARVQSSGSQRRLQLEERVRSAEDERTRLVVQHEQALEKLRDLSETQIGELQIEARKAEDARATLEAELSDLRSQSSAALSELQDGEQHLEQKREQAIARFEARIAELEGQIRSQDEERATIQKDHGREIAASAARILELEAFNDELVTARETLEERSVEGQELARELESRMSEAELQRQQLEDRYQRELADLGASQQVKLQDLEEELLVLRQERDEHAQQHAVEIRRAADSEQRVVTELQGRLRESEMARVELETRHITAMSDFADHSRARLVKLEEKIKEKEQGIRELIEKARTKDSALEMVHSVLRDKERELSELQSRLDEQERANVRLEETSDELRKLQDDLQFSGEKLEEQTSRLLDLMQNVDGQEDWI